MIDNTEIMWKTENFHNLFLNKIPSFIMVVYKKLLLYKICGYND